MKTCGTCKLDKDESEYYSKGKENRLYSQCKSCFNSYCKKRWTERKLKVIEQFGGCCHDCQHSYSAPVYEFHHLDPSAKELAWNKMRLVSETKLQRELAKCIMLCANCHRLRHIEE